MLMYNARMLEHICRHPTLRDTWLASANVQTTGHDIMFTEPYRNAFTAWASADLPPASRRIVTEYWFHALKSTQRTVVLMPMGVCVMQQLRWRRSLRKSPMTRAPPFATC